MSMCNTPSRFLQPNHVNGQTIRFFDVRSSTPTSSFPYTPPTYTDAPYAQKRFPMAIYDKGYSIVGNRALIPIEVNYEGNRAIFHLMEVNIGYDFSVELVKELVLTPHEPDQVFYNFAYYSYAFF